MTTCTVCQGRGEVEAGITDGFICNGHDSEGRELGYPTRVRPNPAAQAKDGTIWILQQNLLEPLWGIAICRRCGGTGIV